MDEAFKHYIQIDESSRVVDGWSDGPTPGRNLLGAICITDRGGYQFRLRPGGEENPLLFGEGMVPLYKWDGNAVQPRSQAEIEEDISALPAPDPAENGQDDVWAALDAAYREGVDNAYDL